MPRGTYCKTLARRRRAALRAIMDSRPFDVEDEFVGGGVLRDGEKSREMLRVGLAINKTPEALLRSLTFYMLPEAQELKLSPWLEACSQGNGDETTDETKEAVKAFCDWFKAARDTEKMELAAGALADGETPKGKAKFRVLERRFAKEWSEACVVNEAATSEAPKVDLEERFGGFLR